MTTVVKAGRYQLLGEIGRGAMGVVYKALDPVIGRHVAVKTMRLSEAGTGMTHEELMARFQTEARAAGLLNHPNIVAVYDAGEDDGLSYITMELVEGRSLQALLDSKQTFPLPRVVRLMQQACSALEFAHQRNIVHRDIKPANIMLTPDDTVKITDFGTAKILQFGTAHTAHVIGTPSYMSPEQVKGKPVDGRSDVFSLGVILYELVTGEKPFPGQNITTVIYKIIHEDPIPPRELDSSLHPGLSAIIMRALAKEPDARYQTCRALMEALRNYRDRGADSDATVAATRAASPRASSAASEDHAPSVPRRPGTLVRSPDISGAHETQAQRGSFWLALVLLVIIAGTCYYLRPFMRDLWERTRPVPTGRPPTTSAPQVTPNGQGQEPSQAQPHAPVPAAAGGTVPNLASAELRAPPPTEKPTQGKPATAPATRAETARVAEESFPVRPLVAEWKWRIERRLAQAGLSERVHVTAAGNTITFGGRLTPQEHRRLLRALRNAPAWLRVIDHIEDTDPADSPG